MIGVISIVIDNPEVVQEVNQILHVHRDAIIGRMGIPYKKRNLNIISVAVDTSEQEIGALKKELSSLDGTRVASVETAD